MNGNNKEELVRKFIDGDLSPAEETHLMHSLADDDSFRELLRLDLLLKLELKAPAADPFEVPADFSDNVMQRISALHASGLPETGFAEKVIQWLHNLLQPRPLTFRPAYGLALAILLVAFFFVIPQSLKISSDHLSNSDAATTAYVTNAAQEENSVVWMRFVYADDHAKSMAIAGDFNNWQPIPMHPSYENNQTIWTITIPLPHKEIHYMFLKDGKDWLSDPLAPQQQDDGFGHHNSVIPL